MQGRPSAGPAKLIDRRQILPGFVSAHVHRSFDGTKVVNYAQWESQEAFTAMLQNPEAAPYLTELSEIGTPAPVLCEVVSVHNA